MRTSESICSLAHRPESPERDGRVVVMRGGGVRRGWGVVVRGGGVGLGGSDQFIFSLSFLLL